MGLVEKIFGSYSKRELKRIKPILDQVLALEEDYKKMSEEDLRGQTEYLKGKLEDGETLDTILPEAFAACREAARRVLGTPHYPVQIIGGIVLHQGRIAEMRTGEGKTQTCLLPAYLNALTGKGVHIVTVNDYLAKRDSEWMGKVYRYLGLSVGLIIHDMDNDARRDAYNCDITYGTNNEIGFDYLRDNMVTYKEQRVQRPFNYAIVDEVDSILIDEARTPLIISGKGDESTDLYQIVDRFARTLTMNKVVELDTKVDNDNLEGDYIVDEKAKTATLTPAGVKKAEAAFRVANLMDPENMTLLHHINQAIKAHGIMHNEEDYVVKDGEVIIVDEFTGRLMYGRRYNEGLHQAIEAKEGVKIAHESKTLATITFQNLFRLYNKLSGMTGTALTEEGEFREIYKLDVIEIPTNRPVQRIDHEDVVYKNEKGKYNAVIEQIIECHKKGQPVLVGTITIDKSEMLSNMLKRRGIPHEVLNAKYHEKEAEIVAQAGKKGAVTIATNMAGRGTDIKLGGNEEYLAKHDMRRMGFSDELIAEADAFGETDDAEILNARQTFKDLVAKHKKVIAVEAEEVRKAGGLFILGTERHESRRIDNQLRGRAGRQGDPGESRFFLSLEDDIMRLFGGERIQNMMEALKIDENQPIETKMLTNSIESAQKKVEGRNFAIRRNVLQFDDVMNRQREIIYSQRAKVLDGENLRSYIMDMLKDSITETVNQYLSDEVIHDNWNVDGLRNHYLGFFTTPEDFHYTPDELANMEKKDFVDALYEKAVAKYEEKEQEIGVERMREVERVVLLRNVDTKWMDHIDAMDELKKGIYLRSYGQRDPVVEYRIEGFDMFDAMVAAIREDTVKMLLTVRLRNPNEELRREQVANPTSESHGDEGGRVQTQAVRVRSPRKP
ncbi:MAG TPA: preprotein translocase subunit SecA [Candidatus Merdivicinus excrementipullorum]|uniref:Protein translocase subunit SecA n=1 Tax=Candidatus Merdivicinus excrementipullorum TaxID=2840867 RepID=A0A9D1FLG7_9FIRM|nr:preprotein translocase subunit SecA [Candidatus Merdivicinus excrementipullorum]